MMGWSWRKSEAPDAVGALPVRLGGWGQSSPQAARLRDLAYDQALLGLIAALLLFGWVMVYSASVALPDSPKYANYAGHHFALRHGVALLIGVVAAAIAFQVPVDAWQRWAPHLFVLGLVLLIAVLIPFIGKGVNGARRWISLGVMNFQPSELAKLGMLLYVANYMVRKTAIKQQFWRAVAPIGAATALVGVLLLAEPDMGAFMVIVVIATGILFLGGVNARAFLVVCLLLVIAFALMIWLSPWRRERIFAYLDPWNPAHALGSSYQLTHALIALGRGQVLGVGLGASVEKLNWLPEAHTDFLLAVIGEEFGWLGVAAICGAFFWLTRRIMHIGRQALLLEREFAGLVAQGVALWLGFQALINIGVNIGALPTKGLTLPLMSYGGSAILINLVALAVVLRIDHENRQMSKGRRQ